MRRYIVVFLIVTIALCTFGCTKRIVATTTTEATTTVDNTTEATTTVDNTTEVTTTVDNTTEELTTGESESSEQVGFTDEELLVLAAKYYKAKAGVEPPHVAIFADDGETVDIYIYEENDLTAVAWDWYYIKRATGRGENLFGDEVDLNSVK